jgi:hypothetical protein
MGGDDSALGYKCETSFEMKRNPAYFHPSVHMYTGYADFDSFVSSDWNYWTKRWQNTNSACQQCQNNCWGCSDNLDFG